MGPGTQPGVTRRNPKGSAGEGALGRAVVTAGPDSTMGRPKGGGRWLRSVADVVLGLVGHRRGSRSFRDVGPDHGGN